MSTLNKIPDPLLNHSYTGDERPCQRCIKRNLQDQCHDGVRKKAKYLHDAPNEALMPGIGANHFPYANNIHPAEQRPEQSTYSGLSTNNPYVPLPVAVSAYPVYPPAAPQTQVTSTLPDLIMNAQTYGSQQSPLSARFNSRSGPPPASMQSLADVMQQTTATDGSVPLQSAFVPTLFDPNDPMQYDFDPASFNFGNHYGALEFGMLGQMSSGAAETPPSDSISHISQTNGNKYTSPSTISTSYSDNSLNVQPYLFNQDQGIGDWRNAPQSNLRHTNTYNSSIRNQESPNGTIKQETVKQETPHAFIIGASSSSLASPTSTSSPQTMVPNFNESPSASNLYPGNVNEVSRSSTQVRSAQQRQLTRENSMSDSRPQNKSPQRIRDSSIIYESVTQPYSYTTGFHTLIAFLQRRFSSQKTLQIAKALASIRPSFIACTKTLNHDDLIFMEKCFQRSLFEYEDFISACGTPTIVCRRTGEIAAVGKEFSILTGWKKSVLLGKEPNLNVNTGGTSGQSVNTASSRGGMNTPRLTEGSKSETFNPSRPQPVLLAELLDDDSVIEFYEDFARLAFGDSRGSVTNQCKLLKYKTKEDMNIAAAGDMKLSEDGRDLRSRWQSNQASHGGKSGIAGEAEIDDLGDKDGKVTCSYCWMVKRDMFDIPMLIVMNVSSPSLSLWKRFMITLTRLDLVVLKLISYHSSSLVYKN